MKTVDHPDSSADLDSLSDRISHAIRRGKFSAAEFQDALAGRSRRIARKTDELVHDYAWTAIGVGIGVGFLVGVLAGRNSRSPAPAKKMSGVPPDEEEPSSGWGAWEKLQTALPLVLLGVKAVQEWRGSRPR